MSAISSRSGFCEADVERPGRRRCTCGAADLGAPPRTCPSAISSLELAAADARWCARRRSPGASSSSITSGSMPETTARRRLEAPRGALALGHPRQRAMCAGVVPQHPPTRLTQPASTKRSSLRASVSGVSLYWPSSSGRPALGTQATAKRRQLAKRAQVVGHELGAGRAVEAHRRAGRVRERRRKRLDVLPGQHRAHRLDRAGDRDRHAPAQPRRTRARSRSAPALMLSVSWHGLQQQQVDAALDEARGLLLVGVSISSSKVMPPVTEMALVVGPIEPATKRGRVDVVAASPAARAIEPARRLISKRLLGEPVLGQHDRGRAEGVGLDDVGAGVEVAVVDSRSCRGGSASGSRCILRAAGRRNRRP